MANLERSDYSAGDDAVPHAIVWRPLSWFSQNLKIDEDDLDVYSSTAFLIGNHAIELRHYNRHPENTSTFYTSLNQVENNADTDALINKAFEIMHVPEAGVAWRRGQSFRPGELHRSPEDRLLEPEARNLALKIAATQRNCSASTAFIRRSIPAYFPLTEWDKRVGARDPLWHQIVRNVVSNAARSTSVFKNGHARRIHRGIQVTDEGLEYLKASGFVSEPRP